MSNESSEKPLLSPGSARAMDLANMRKQRLVLDWRVPALTGRIGRIHSKQGFSEVSVISSQFRFLCLSPSFDVGLWTGSILLITRHSSPFFDSRLGFHVFSLTPYSVILNPVFHSSLITVSRLWTLDFGLVLSYSSLIALQLESDRQPLEQWSEESLEGRRSLPPSPERAPPKIQSA